MKQGIACRHCGSPARFNPCWYSIKYPGSERGGGDPPCIGDMYDEDQAARAAESRRQTINVALLLSGAAACAAYLIFY